MRWHGIFSVALSIIPVQSLFVDEAYNIDFHHALLGIPQPHSTFFHKPDASSNAALLYSLSDKAVLGALNPRDGSLVWRQSLASQPTVNATTSFLVAGEGDGKVTTALGKEVATWDASDGRLVWKYTARGEVKAVDLQAVPVLGSSTDGAVQDVILLTQPLQEGGRYVVSRIGGDGSGERWRHEDVDTKPDAQVGVATSPKHLFYITKSAGLPSGQRTKVVVFDIITGKQLKEYSPALDSETVAVDSRLASASGSEAPLLITSEMPYKTIKLNLLGNNKVSTITLDDKGEDIVSVSAHSPPGTTAESHFLLHVRTATKNWAEVYHMNTATGESKRAYSLPAIKDASAFAASNNGKNVFFTRATSTEVSVYSSQSHGHLGRWPRNVLAGSRTSSTDPIYAIAEVATRDNTNTAVRTAIISPEGSLYLVRNGDTQWVRAEMLAYAELAAWFDYAQVTPLAQELSAEVSVDPATAYINRVYRHAKELMHLPNYLVKLAQGAFGPAEDKPSVREDLLGSRSLILATSRKQIVSLSGISGAIQWYVDLPSAISDGAVVRSLAISEGRVTIYTSDGSISVLNATTGGVIETKTGTIPAARIIELPGTPASTLLKVNEEGVPQVAVDLAPSVPLEGNVVMTQDQNGNLVGWTVGTTVRKTWTFTPTSGKIVAVTTRPEQDPIASIGKVLGDRSVLYKYFTPNMAVLTTMSNEILTMYLIDAVTGAILHTSSHVGVLDSFPISAVLSENWYAYTFTSSNPETNALSTQLIISELYESDVPNDRGQLSAQTNYSSFGPDGNVKPHVVSAAFTLAEPMSHLTVTQTAQGITSRSLLAYLPGSHAMIAIPRHVLDARRPIDRDPTSSEAEEGLFRYTPELSLDPKTFLSHARDVVGISHISAVPTLLESTSTVFGFGHDIFGTQVAPSQTFDVLGKNFSKFQLLATVVALYLGVLALRPLVRRNVVKRGWL